MGGEIQARTAGGWKKAISPGRDRMQSQVLAWAVGLLLAACALARFVAVLRSGGTVKELLLPLLVSFAFAALVRGLRAATLPAALVGFLVCFILSQRPAFPHALWALVALFVLTYAATKYGRLKKEAGGMAEPRNGRRASQIVANLGVAALCAAAGWYVACIAALAEAAADTVSSEIGQAIGGPAWLITTLRRVTPGTDGGVSAAGTAAGVGAAIVIVAIGLAHPSSWPDKAAVLIAACGGLVFDSLLGATVERRGWVGNDLVNFTSTLFAAVLATALRGSV